MIQNQEQILNRKNVCGVGETDVGIVVLVEKKLPLDQLHEKDVVPEVFDGRETDVIEVGEITTAVSGAPASGTSCTIGAVCYKNGKSYFLQNAHCLPRRNTQAVGQDFVAPAPADGNGNVVGKVSDWSLLSAGMDIKVDALIAESHTPQTDSFETIKAFVGAQAHSFGRTTSYQEHRIVATGVTINVRVNNEFTARFVDQIMYLGKTRAGDSGSTLKIGDKICGLIFASNGDNIGFANDIDNVIEEMDISFSAPKTIERRWRYFTPEERTGQFGTISQLKLQLVDFLDEVRHRVGFPISLSSGFRTVEHNKRVGGAPSSSHLFGWAGDCIVRNTAQADAIVRAAYEIEKEWYNGERRLQIGVNCKSGNSGFVHIGLDPNRSAGVLWTY